MKSYLTKRNFKYAIICVLCSVAILATAFFGYVILTNPIMANPIGNICLNVIFSFLLLLAIYIFGTVMMFYIEEILFYS